MKKSNTMKIMTMVICAVLLISAIALVGGVAAKYLHRHLDGDSAVGAARFYVESNYLATIHKDYYLNANTPSVTVELYNFLDEYRVSEVDIQYTVTVETTDAAFSLTDGQKETAENTVRVTKTIAVPKEKTTTQIPLEGLKNGHSYTVKVVAKGGYEKTLSATFHVAESADKSGFTVTRNDNFVVLTIWMGSTGGTVTFTVPEGLIPDETDPFLANKNNYSVTDGKYTYTVGEMGPYTSVSYRFFITTGYTANSKFEVYVDGTQLTSHEVT